MNLEFECNLSLSSHSKDVFEAFQLLYLQKKHSHFELFNLKQEQLEEEIEKLKVTVEKIKQQFTTLIVIGMGGAILNPKAIAPYNRNKELEFIFLDTLDPVFFQQIKSKVSLDKVGFLVISKSGETIETISLCLSWIEILKQNAIKDLAKHFFFIVGVNKNSLRNIALDIKADILPHANIGGRFASFSNINLLLLKLMDQDAKAFGLGGMEVLQDFLNNENNSFIARSLSFLIEVVSKSRSIHVNIAYLLILQPYLEWNSQIIAESLGKSGFGITPIEGYGPEDQHSQLQLYLDGPLDKFFTLFYAKEAIHAELPKLTFQGLAGKDIQEIQTAQYNALYDVLNENGLPVRKILIKEQNIKSLGALMMFSMLETVLFAIIKGINPLDQPAVDSMKKQVYKLLK